ncbi:uncharacterized protein LOC129607589 [Condylostylus longicornis]|uniref:uncharacterized protein LOC129607589 n=1 Tax=Condylostylus longicornis TaxID=2530218 RepID=UPI00244DCA0E|nr:uncharacterized protein LOC129607589 [Condylostylus longicornis]
MDRLQHKQHNIANSYKENRLFKVKYNISKDANGWNQLCWPTTKRAAILEKLQRDLNSVPSNNWTYQNCKKKRAGFKNYESAELQIMESKAETEDETFPLPTEKPKKPPTRTRNLFNTMWETSCNLSSNTEVSSVSVFFN